MSDIERVQIGTATLYRGDCLQVMHEIEHADHCIADPPYEESMHTKDRIVLNKGRDGHKVTTEAHRFAAMDEYTRSEITRLIIEKCDGWVLLFCQSEGAHYWREQIIAHNGKYRFTGVWVKPTYKPNINGDSPGLGYESIVGGWCSGGRSKWNGGGKAAVWTANPEQRRGQDGNTHTSIKPQALMTQLVGLFTDPGQIVLDTFMGSGSTGVAAVSMGRKFIGIERDPEYFDICCRRIEDAQKGLFHEPYVKSKARVAVSLIPEEEKKPAAKIAAPKARAPKIAVADTVTETKIVPVRRFAAPSIVVAGKPAVEQTREKKPLADPLQAIIDKYGADPIDFGPWDDEPGSGGAVGMDVESYHNFFLVNFERFGNGQKLSLEMSDRAEMNLDRLRHIVESECIITFNGMSYDMPMVALALKGADTFALKQSSNRLIGPGSPNYWEVEKELGIRLPRSNHVDLIEPCPAIRQPLKAIAGRLHCKTIMGLPYHHDSRLTHEQMNVTSVYCFHDIADTKQIFLSLKEPLTLRVALGKEYGLDLRSKSDAQVGEAIVRKRAEKLLGRKLKKGGEIPSTARYQIPSFISFESGQMREVVDRIRSSEFSVDSYGKVVMPDWLKGKQIKFGTTTYSMGIGGLHSTEETRALLADDEYCILDVDVASQYPRILILLGMYPAAIGPVFVKVYEAIVDERLQAKERLKVLKALMKEAEDIATKEAIKAETGQVQQKSEGGKIQVNGVFGKLGSIYSILFAPDMLIATTLTGQLSILMLIERAEHVGISVVSANTDGVVFYFKRSRAAELDSIIKTWEETIGFEVERTYYKALYNSSVNSYIAVKDDAEFKVKLKGPWADPWSENSLREMMMKNPQMTVLTTALVEYLKNGTPFEDTIRACKDVRKFVTVINVKAGGEWRKSYLGTVVRYYWSTDGDPITYVKAGRKVAKTDGCKPMMTLPDELPDDIDYAKYVEAATEIAYDTGILERPTMFKKGKARA